MDEALPGLIELMLPLIQAAALIVARPLGFIIIFPVFGWMGLVGMIRTVTAFVIGFPMFESVYGDLLLANINFAPEVIVMLVGKEFLVGAVIGIVLGAPFWAAETAGSYVDVFRGTSSATVVSPDQMAEPLVTGAIFSIALVAIFLVMGGLRVAVDAIYESFQIWPMFQLIPEISEALYPIFIELLSKIFRVALALGAPIMIAMFLGEIALAYASRFAQQINVFDATLSAKNLIFLFIMPPYLYMLTAFYADDVLDIDGLVEIMGRMVAR